MWKRSNCPLTGEWQKKNVYEDNGIVLDYKKKLNTNITTMWMTLKDFILSEEANYKRE